jgi:hypothetical protein
MTFTIDPSCSFRSIKMRKITIALLKERSELVGLRFYKHFAPDGATLRRLALEGSVYEDV